MIRHARIDVEEIIARAVFDPNGQHRLEVVVPSEVIGMRFTAGHVQQLKTAIAQFEAMAGGEADPDFHLRKFVTLEISQ